MYSVCQYAKEDDMESTAQPRTREAKDARLNLRLTAKQDQLIREGASAADKPVSEFILAASTVEAERQLADRRWFLLDDDQWARFNELLDAPFETDERLRELMTSPVVVEGIDQ